MAAIVSLKDLWVFFMHIVQDGGQGELDMVSIFILSILIQMSTSIQLHYCFRKLNSYSVQLLNTNVLPEFESK